MYACLVSEGKVGRILKDTCTYPQPRFIRANTFQVPCTFADDEHVFAAGIDPNIVHQPDISYEKFLSMKADLVKDHGDMYVNFKKSGNNEEMHSFCKGKLILDSVPMCLGGLSNRN